MPKTRTLDPEFWDDTVIDSLPIPERLLAVAIITLLADDEGRFVAEPSVVKKRVFGLDKDIKPERVGEMLDHMAEAWKNLRLYRVDGQIYGVLRKFSEKQGIRYVVKSKIPAYDKSFDLKECGNLPEISADSPRVEKSRVEKSSSAPQKATRVPVPFDVTPEMREWAEREHPSVDIASQTKSFVDYWKGVPGAKGVKLDWPATWRNNVRDCAERGKFVRKATGQNPKPPKHSEVDELFGRSK